MVKKKKLKTEATACSSHSTYQRATAKRKAGSQNDGKEIMDKLGFEKDESVDEDDADKGSSKRNTDALIDYMTTDFMKRKKINR